MATLPQLTSKASLKKLMTAEFHAVGSETFDDTEPKNYLKRLTAKQEELLADDTKVPTGSLTAFITFGDGFIHRPIGADFCDTVTLDGVTTRDSVRPNSSLAIFYKYKTDDVSSIELAFYTRFFVISYYSSCKWISGLRPSSKNKDKKVPTVVGAREYCYRLDKLAMNDPDRTALEKQIFDAMSKRQQVKNVCSPATLLSNGKPITPKRYGLFISTVSNHGAAGTVCFPYLRLLEPVTVKGKTEWQYPSFVVGDIASKIHGAYNTKGCWMLGRNFTWNWPNEDKVHTDQFQIYKKIMDCYLKKRAQPTYDLVSAVKALPGCGHLDSEDKIYELGHNMMHQPYSRNYAYFHLINLLAGLAYNKQDDNVEDYVDTDCFRPAGTDYNCWKANANTWMPNVYGKTYSRDQVWSYLYLFRRTKAPFTPDPGDTADFT